MPEDKEKKEATTDALEENAKEIEVIRKAKEKDMVVK